MRQSLIRLRFGTLCRWSWFIGLGMWRAYPSLCGTELTSADASCFTRKSRSAPKASVAKPVPSLQPRPETSEERS